MSFNISALDAFRNANLGGENAIANLGQGDNAPPDKSEDLLYGVIDALNQGDETLNASEKLGRFLRGRQGEARRQDGEDRGPVQERRDRLL